MSRRFRLKDLLPAKRVPPVAPLAKDYYVTVMAARQPLPIMAAIAAPKGANEAVPGFIVRRDRAGLGNERGRAPAPVRSFARQARQETLALSSIVLLERSGKDRR